MAKSKFKFTKLHLVSSQKFFKFKKQDKIFVYVSQFIYLSEKYCVGEGVGLSGGGAPAVPPPPATLLLLAIVIQHYYFGDVKSNFFLFTLIMTHQGLVYHQFGLTLTYLGAPWP